MDVRSPHTVSFHAPSRFPLPGQRILRSVFSVWCCIVVYWLRGQRGAPFYSVIAALQCVQPYTANILKVGGNRIRGTLVGAFWGTVVLLVELYVIGGQYEENLLHYLLLGLFSGVVLYSTVLLKITDSSYFSAVVFLSIAMNHIDDLNPWIYIFDRTLDTIIGVGVALLACAVHLPRLRMCRTLFVTGIDHVLFREDRNLTPFTKVELNRFIQDGMLFSVSTKQTPATVRELLQGVNLRLPIIAMDGAVLYDLGTRKYIETRKMDEDLAVLVTDFLHREQMPFFVNTVEDNLLVIYYKDYKEELMLKTAGITLHGAHHAPADASVSVSSLAAMHRLYLKKNVSPYRNYVRADHDMTDNVLYLLVIDQKERIDRLYEALKQEPWFSRCRAAFDTFDCEEGEEILRIYAASATRASMQETLRGHVGAEKMITFGNTPGECDVLVSDEGGDYTVRELKKRFEPVDLRGWRNMIRL